MLYAQPMFSPGEWDAQTWDTNGSPSFGQTTKKKKKKTENRPNYGLFCLGWPQSKIERKWKEGQIPWPCSGIEKTMKHKSEVYTNGPIVIGIFETVTKGLIKGLEDLEIRGRVETI